MIRLARPVGAAVLAVAITTTILSSPAHAVASTSIAFTAYPTAKIGEYNLLTVSVTSSDGVTQPEGGVVFRNGAGEILGSATTGRGSSVANAVATLPWWPTQQASYVFTAQYNVASGIPLTGSTTPSAISILATPSGQNVSMTATQMYLGVPATMTATVYPTSLQGSVGFTGNGWGLGPSVPIVNGGATFAFTPGSLGWQEFGVSFTSTNVAGAQGQVAQWVKVLPTPAHPVAAVVAATALPVVPTAAVVSSAKSKAPAKKPTKKPLTRTKRLVQKELAPEVLTLSPRV